MLKEVIASGENISEAKSTALTLLGASELDQVNFEIIDLGSKGIMGLIGKKPAKVKATMEVPDPTPVAQPRAQKKHADKKPQQQPQQPKEVAPIVIEQLHYEPIETIEADDKAYNFLMQLLENLGIKNDVQVEYLRAEDGTRKINVTGDKSSMLIGHHGETLDALQYLVNLTLTKRNADEPDTDRSRVTVDVEGYRAKREITLRKLAHRMANKALQKGSKVTLEPMSPYERRIIHSEVQNIEGVTTQSIGTDSNRRIVIYVERPGSKNEIPVDDD